ncbi:MAG: type II toxin-antitoxin system RelE/ParE family toxin [Chloroflexota bacterium]
MRNDVSPLIEQLQAGETPGDRIAGTGHVVYKTRLKNSDIQKGKSGGYRVIYLVQNNQIVILLIIYAKSDTDDISSNEIVSVIDALEN